MSRMTIPQLMAFYNGVPKREEISVAICAIKPIRNKGHNEYDVMETGEALINFYDRAEKRAMVRYEHRRDMECTYSLDIANRFKARREAIEQRMKELKRDANHQAII